MGMPRAQATRRCAALSELEYHLHMCAFDAEDSILDKPVYSLAQVDSILGLRRGLAREWLKQYGKDQEVIATWGDFIEVAFFAHFRSKKVKTKKLAMARDILAKRLDTPYPFASKEVWASYRELVMEVQKAEELEGEIEIGHILNGQLELMPSPQAFLDRIEFNEFAERFYPRHSRTVVIDPLVSFGEPCVSAVRTEVLSDYFDAGDSVSTLAKLFDLQSEAVEEAIRYEGARRRKDLAAVLDAA